MRVRLIRGLYLPEMPHSTAVKKNGGFNPDTFLATIGDGRKILTVAKKQAIFAQGDDADAVFYVQKGKVRLTVVSKIGKEATIAIVASLPILETTVSLTLPFCT